MVRRCHFSCVEINADLLCDVDHSEKDVMDMVPQADALELSVLFTLRNAEHRRNSKVEKLKGCG